MSTPDILALSRILLVPFIMAFTRSEQVESNLAIAAALFAIAAFTDFLDGYQTTPEQTLGETYPSPGSHRELVVVTHLRFHSMCPHHLLPFAGTAHVAYLPKDRVVGFGRLGNYIGGELWGKYTQAGWGVIFPRAEAELSGMSLPQLQAQFASGALDRFARHPSQLYQAFLEGLVMFAVLWWFSSKPRPRYAVSGLFALLYGCFRFLVEFVRVPDPQLGYLAFGWVTMGQVLSAPMIIAGVILWVLAHKRASKA